MIQLLRVKSAINVKKIDQMRNCDVVAEACQPGSGVVCGRGARALFCFVVAERMKDILELRGSEKRRNNSLTMGNNYMYNNSFLSADLQLSEFIEPMQKKNTIKELLMMKRQMWGCSQDNNISGHKFKSSKLEVYPIYTSPPLLEPVYYVECPPGNGHGPSPPGQNAAMQGQASPTAEIQLTLFHWQTQQEEQKVGGVSLEQLNMQDADGDTFLHIAVAQGKRALSYVLAAKMARCGSLEIKEHHGQTALHLAAATNQHMIVQDLLLHGAQINARDLWGRSALHVCAEKGHFLSLQSIWKAFTQSGHAIDMEVFNYDGLTPLHAAVVTHNAAVKELQMKEHTCLRVTTELLQRKRQCVECIKILLLMGASFGTKDLKSGRTCLHMAAEEANVELFAVFFSQQSSLSIVNAKTFSGNTALHVVSSLQNHQTQVEAMKQLMKNGADPSARNMENELPSQLVPEGPVGKKVKQILKGKYCHA
ncbi:NF-kappa-B inhibitor zeta isoform X2 [Antennarius striatus]|uniref:NF-kappa-B inhibitor zeta isoform X2 n=1 Tax=Antennarius striatus TaxID=241820 RepID=UPI0035B18294